MVIEKGIICMGNQGLGGNAILLLLYRHKKLAKIVNVEENLNFILDHRLLHSNQGNAPMADFFLPCDVTRTAHLNKTYESALYAFLLSRLKMKV